jgi:hypothetical protein
MAQEQQRRTAAAAAFYNWGQNVQRSTQPPPRMQTYCYTVGNAMSCY